MRENVEKRSLRLDSILEVRRAQRPGGRLPDESRRPSRCIPNPSPEENTFCTTNSSSPPVTGQTHCYVPTSQSGDEIRRNLRGVRKGFIVDFGR